MDPRIRHLRRTFYRVPFLDPYWGRDEWSAALGRNDGDGARQRLAARLEDLGYRDPVLAASGRCGLELALRTVPVGEVIVPSLICGSVVRAAVNAGHRPVFADVKEDLSISVESVRRCLSPATAAIVVPHLSGIVCSDFDEILDLGRRSGTLIVDDAAQALGVDYRGRKLGTFGDFGLLSFGVGKPTFSIGGGALVNASAEQAASCRRLLTAGPDGPRHPGVSPVRFLAEFHFRRFTAPFFLAGRALGKVIPGGPPAPRCREIRGDEAAVQTARLERLDQILATFQARTAMVVGAAGEGPFDFPQLRPGAIATKLVIRSVDLPTRELFRRLLKRGIETEWWYTPAENRPAFARYRRSRNPVAESLAPRLLAIPNHPGLSEEQAAFVGHSLREAFHAG